MKLAASLALVIASAGCSEQVHVKVDCISTTEGATCTLIQDRGKTEVEVCWDFAVTCGNGSVVSADRACQKVGDGATVEHLITNDKLHGKEQCGGTGPKGALKNITLNGEKSE